MQSDFTIGIDISKDTLDVFSLPDEASEKFENSRKGFKKLISWLQKREIGRIVFEATGAYHRDMEMALDACGFKLCKVNPARAKQFSRAIGGLAKTDRCDAIMLAKMGVLLKPQIREPRAQHIEEIRELWVAHEALNKARTATLTRGHNTKSPLVKSHHKATLKLILRQLAEIEEAMLALARKDEGLCQKLEILLSIPGIGEITALGLIANMPELGSIENKSVAALAGLAPVTRQSGKWQGKSFIQGGRSEIRRLLYFPAMVAARFNQDLKVTYTRLILAKKPAKIAITAVMRKLLILANALLRKNHKWMPINS